MEREYSNQEYFNAWKPEGGSYETLREQAPDLLDTVDAMLNSEAFIGQHTFIREINGEIVLQPDIQFFISDEYRNRQL